MRVSETIELSIVDELRKKEYRLKKLQEAIDVLEREKLEKVNVTDPMSQLMKDSRKGVVIFNG